jgi:mono/diheme cytochrome c family protein
MKWQIILGTFSVAALVGVLAFVAVGETRRMAEFTAAYQARQIETGASLFENSCRPCHGPQGKGIEGVAPALNAVDLFNGDRLKRIGYTGTVQDYIRGTIMAGRPVPSQGANYPQRMPTWGQRFGGPLRDDEIDSLVAFIMNWKDRALAEGQPPSTPAVLPGAVGTDITISLPAGDAANGQKLIEGPLGCVGCHILSATGPAWKPAPGSPGIGERASSRITQSDYTGSAKTPEQYLVESILIPRAFVVSGYENGIMPENYGERLTAQDLADIVAYLQSLR